MWGNLVLLLINDRKILKNEALSINKQNEKTNKHPPKSTTTTTHNNNKTPPSTTATIFLIFLQQYIRFHSLYICGILYAYKVAFIDITMYVSTDMCLRT